MKIIDLLNKIANGEEVPKKIKYDDDIYIHVDNYCYYCQETNEILSQNIYAEFSRLNDEVEIIEEEKEIEKKIEKKIEKIIISMDDVSMPYVTNNKYQRLSYSEVDLLFASKINELIDVINDMRDKE